MRMPTLASAAVCALLASSASLAENPSTGNPPPNGITVGFSRRNSVSPPLRAIPVAPLARWPQHVQREPLGTISKPREATDPVVQTHLAPAAMPGTILNFFGTGYPGVGCYCVPPDANGEVGATQYVQMVNEGIQVFDKSTGETVLGPDSITSLWSGFGGFCETSGFGNPVVLYDQLADRWVITEFAGSSTPTEECVAVSTTGDATGSYYRYDFNLGSNFFNDPKLAVWPDAYYLAMNVFDSSGTTFLGPQPFALDRAAMLAGDPATFITPGIQSSSLGAMLSADLDGSNPPPAGAPNPWLSTEGATWSLYRFHVDWSTPSSSTFLLGGSLSPAGYTSLCPGTRSCVPQADTSDRLDGLGDRPMFRLAYRHFADGHEALVGNRSVEANGVAGIRWWEINNATSGTPALVQESTYQPDATWRWAGSAAMDAQGNLALGFSASSASIHPEIRYAGRRVGDAAGTLGQGESLLNAGGSSQTGSGNRWGDYSDLTVDPVDDCTFWYTNEYYCCTTSGFNWSTGIGNFKFPGCSTGPTGRVQGQVTFCASGLPFVGASVSTGAITTTTDGNGNYSLTLPTGDYVVSISDSGYSIGGGPVTITDGANVVLDACLSGVPVIGGTSAAVTAENCPPGNGVLDPDETVTVSLCLKNTGVAAAGDLVATLEATGGVVTPSSPQSYGAVPNDGTPVCRDFVFTVAASKNCGDNVTATLDLQDGSSSVGTVTYPFTIGVASSLSENFDGVVAPALPTGWTVSGTPGAAPWATVTDPADTPPNSATVSGDADNVTDRSLDSPPIPITTTTATLTFRNFWDMDAFRDGGVLEISIGGGPFQDILAAGGSFIANGYTGTIASDIGSPIGGRQAWTGYPPFDYLTTVVNLPPSAARQIVVLRWRAVTDQYAVYPFFWSIDTISVPGFACCAPLAASLRVDALPPAAPKAVGSNGVFEPGETVLVEPGYYNPSVDPVTVSGTASSFTGPAGATYTLVDGTANYGSIASGSSADCFDTTGDCYVMSIDNPATRPATHWDATFDETLSTGKARTWTLHVGESFADAGDADPLYGFIETILHKGITGGCGSANYCPGSAVTRAQMAVFLLKAEHGSGYTPPACTGIFGDVACPSPFADWIEALAAEGITSGCGGGNYCPNVPVRRDQMAVFLLKAEHGSSYVPPGCTGIFGDVPCPSVFADWIERLAAESVTGGCGGGNYCPSNPNTRGQMAVFLVKTFGLQLYGP